MSYCWIKGKMCELATSNGYCSVTACTDYKDEAILSSSMIYVLFSKLKEHMADDEENENA